MKPLVILASLLAALVLPPASSALADNPHTGGTTRGRPNQSCETLPDTARPGHASTARGSAFNPTGIAGTHYAGEQMQNSGNGQASQYDVACFQHAAH